MKKMNFALGALVVVLGVTPIAAAGPGGTEKVRDFAIDVKAEALPVSLGELEYPYAAASRGRSGECSISVNVGANGAADGYRVSSCSHASFIKAANEFASTLSYGPEHSGEAHDLKVVWSTN